MIEHKQNRFLRQKFLLCLFHLSTCLVFWCLLFMRYIPYETSYSKTNQNIVRELCKLSWAYLFVLLSVVKLLYKI